LSAYDRRRCAQPIGDPSGVTARPATGFIDSLGVCTHVAQGTTTGITPIQTLTAVTGVPLTLTDHPVVLEVE
jgi:hypothetical protein